MSHRRHVGCGRHALATGAFLPDRVLGVLSICGAWPYDGGDGFLDGMDSLLPDVDRGRARR